MKKIVLLMLFLVSVSFSKQIDYNAMTDAEVNATAWKNAKILAKKYPKIMGKKCTTGQWCVLGYDGTGRIISNYDDKLIIPVAKYLIKYGNGYSYQAMRFLETYGERNGVIFDEVVKRCEETALFSSCSSVQIAYAVKAFHGDKSAQAMSDKYREFFCSKHDDVWCDSPKMWDPRDYVKLTKNKKSK